MDGWSPDPEILRRVQETVWDNFYDNGGWGMYPTTLFGFFLVLAAVLYAFRPEARYMSIVLTTGAITLAFGVLGMFTGLMHVYKYVQYVGPEDVDKLVAAGWSEASVNVTFALLIVILAAFAVLAGVIRKALRPSAA